MPLIDHLVGGDTGMRNKGRGRGDTSNPFSRRRINRCQLSNCKLRIFLSCCLRASLPSIRLDVTHREGAVKFKCFIDLSSGVALRAEEEGGGGVACE